MGLHKTTIKGFGIMIDFTDEFWKNFIKYRKEFILEKIKDNELYDEMLEGALCGYEFLFAELIKEFKLEIGGDLVDNDKLLLHYKDSGSFKQYACSMKIETVEKRKKKYSELDTNEMTNEINKFMDIYIFYEKNGKKYKLKYDEPDYEVYYYESLM